MNEEQLPPHNEFYSTLKQSNITNEDYLLAKRNWDELECKTLYDYTMNYLKIDVLLLADLFENFRDQCLDYYDIDPFYTYSTPGLNWLAGLKFTGVKLKHYKESTYNKLLFFEKWIRGGVSSILGNRYVKCYNKKVSPDYGIVKELTDEEGSKLIEEMNNNPDSECLNNMFNENYLLYYDYNLLYSSCSIQELPTGEMECSDNLNYERTKEGHGNNGYVCEVDLEYGDRSAASGTKFHPD